VKRLTDRVAVVTGAAGGIGRATSVALARAGCDLAISDVRAVDLEETAALVRATGRRVICHEVDVSDRARMEAYADEVVDAYGAVHVLVNNAGVTVTKTFAEHTLDDFDWLLGINLNGVIYGCKVFLPHLERTDEAHIVNLSSVFGLAGIPTQTSYCASKFAVRGFSEALWTELRPLGIGVTHVCPAGVRTGIASAARTEKREARELAERLIARGVTPEYAADKIVAAIRGNRMRLLISPTARAIDLVKRAAPAAVQRLIGAQFARMRRDRGSRRETEGHRQAGGSSAATPRVSMT
jgi:short-subunit dehydrogenase